MNYFLFEFAYNADRTIKVIAQDIDHAIALSNGNVTALDLINIKPALDVGVPAPRLTASSYTKQPAYCSVAYLPLVSKPGGASSLLLYKYRLVYEGKQYYYECQHIGKLEVRIALLVRMLIDHKIKPPKGFDVKKAVTTGKTWSVYNVDIGWCVLKIPALDKPMALDVVNLYFVEPSIKPKILESEPLTPESIYSKIEDFENDQDDSDY